MIRLSINYLAFHGNLVIFSDELILLTLVFTLLLMYNLAELGFYLNAKFRSSLAEVEKFRKENAEYQFEMLKLQLNPHFLFNSLNTLSSLVHSDPVKSRRIHTRNFLMFIGMSWKTGTKSWFLFEKRWNSSGHSPFCRASVSRE